MNTTKRPKTQQNQYVDKNPIEALRDIGGGVAQSISSDVAKGTINSLWDQLLGLDHNQQGTKESHGDLSEGQEMSLGQGVKAPQEYDPYLDIEPGINYRQEVLHGEKRISQENNHEISMKIQEIIVELKRLTATSQVLHVEFAQVIVQEQKIVNPGKYHITFFEWLLSIIKMARMRVEDSSSWLAMFKSKKSGKGYWNMFKKHGTTFGLSNERVVATQTG